MNRTRRYPSQLSADEVRAVRNDSRRQHVIADCYGLSQSAVSMIKSHKSRADVPDAPPLPEPADMVPRTLLIEALLLLAAAEARAAAAEARVAALKPHR